MRTTVVGAFLLVCSSFASLAVAKEEEAAGVLELSEAVPERQMRLCRDVCKLRNCEAASAEEWLQNMVTLRGASALHRHLLAAWSVTVWKPELLLRRILEKWRDGVFGSANIVHGSMWQAMRFLTQKGSLDAEFLLETMFDDYLNNWNLTASPPPPFLETWVHGFGHGALYAAHKSQTDNASLSCNQGAFETTSETARLAESVCEALPRRPLQYFCASGIYHSMQSTPGRLDNKEAEEETLSLASFGHSHLFDLCESVNFPAICIDQCIYQRLIDVLDESQVKNLVIQLATQQAKDTTAGEKEEDTTAAEDASTATAVAAAAAKKDAPPLRDIVAPFCPPQRWGDDLLGCHYAVSAAFAKTNLWTPKGFCEMPMSYEVCRPVTDRFDETVATFVRACVAGLFSRPSIFASDRHKRCPKDELASNCRQSCDLLKHDPNPNLQAAFRQCRDNYACLDSHDPPPTHMDVMFNVSLVDGHHHPATSHDADRFSFDDSVPRTVQEDAFFASRLTF